MAVRHSRPRAATQKRKSTWLFFQQADLNMSAVGGGIFGSLNAAALALRPFTVVRSHFQLFLRSDQAAALEEQYVSFGACVVSDQASAIGITAVPTPFTDMGSDLWYTHLNLFGDESSLTDRTRPGTQAFIDSKAMRKVDVGQDVMILGEFATGGQGVIFTAAGRILVKLH